MDLVRDQEAIQSAVDKLLASCHNDEDRHLILQQFAGLKAKLACVKNAVEQKTAAYDILLEYSQSWAAVRVTTVRLHERLMINQLSAEELSDLQSDLERARSDLVDLEARRLEVEPLLSDAGITVRDRNTEKFLDMRDDINKLLSDVESDEKKLKLCLRVLDLNLLLSGVSDDLSEMGVVYLDNVGAFTAAVKVSSLCVLLICTVLMS